MKIKADRKRNQAAPSTLTNLHTLTLDQMRELAMRDCSEYSSDDLAIAWELFDRLVEGGRIIEADRQPLKHQGCQPIQSGPLPPPAPQPAEPVKVPPGYILIAEDHLEAMIGPERMDHLRRSCRSPAP